MGVLGCRIGGAEAMANGELITKGMKVGAHKLTTVIGVPRY
jgi:hypothetical protein